MQHQLTFKILIFLLELNNLKGKYNNLIRNFLMPCSLGLYSSLKEYRIAIYSISSSLSMEHSKSHFFILI